MRRKRSKRRVSDVRLTPLAERFFDAYEECRLTCVARELPPPFGDDIDHAWVSNTDKRRWRFSDIAYMYLTYTFDLVELMSDGEAAAQIAQRMLDNVAQMRPLLLECRKAAMRDANERVLEMVEQVDNLCDLWESFFQSRLADSERAARTPRRKSS